MLVRWFCAVPLRNNSNGFLSGGSKVRPFARMALVAFAGGHEKPFQLAPVAALLMQFLNDGVGNGAEQVIGVKAGQALT